MFACVFEDGIAVKIPETEVKRLLEKEGFKPFNPLCRAVMREWICLERKDNFDYLRDQNTFELSIDFVSKIK